MPHVATLVAPPVFDGLPEVASRLARALDATPDWLDPGRAVDLVVPAGAAPAIAAEVAAALDGLPVDHAVQPVFGRRRRLLLADMDSTVITIECIDAVARRAGIGDEIAEITRRTIEGELDFAASLVARVPRLAGTPLAMLEACWREEVAFMPGAATLVATMRAHGATTALVSGGFTWFTDRVGAALGFDVMRANRLRLDADRLDGKLEGPILDRGAKVAALDELARARGLSRAEAIAVGDGANDIDMLEAAGLGVAYRAVPRAEAAADAAVRHGDLTALLFIQGFRRAEFVVAEPQVA